jgi:hypothetical protein
MGFFNTILEKLGIKKEAPAATGAAKPAAPAASKPAAMGGAGAGKASVTSSDMHAQKDEPGLSAAVKPAAVPVVDVMSKLENMAGSNSGLDWKVSIVDLLKLLGIDSSLQARKDLATELGCPADLMSDSAKMNTWLHKTVLKKIAENGGNIPQSMLD